MQGAGLPDWARSSRPNLATAAARVARLGRENLAQSGNPDQGDVRDVELREWDCIIHNNNNNNHHHVIIINIKCSDY